jgi:hypothetical protein
MNRISRKLIYFTSISFWLILAMATSAAAVVERAKNSAIDYHHHTLAVNFHSINVYNKNKNHNRLLLSTIKNYIKSAAIKSSKTPNNQANIAFIAPTFTAAAYDNAFYEFYDLHQLARTNVTTDLNLLSAHITSKVIHDSELPMLKLIKDLRHAIPRLHIGLYSDRDVDNGFLSTTNQKHNHYDIIVIGHQEYVTQREYNNLKQFLSNGGKLIILDGNVFFAEVKYDRDTQTVTLVKGHWWAFNGKSAWKSVGERWKQETSQWIGSNYLCYNCVDRFTNDPFGYRPHEEQYITNHDDTIVLNYDAAISNKFIRTKPVIATYELNYQKGKVVALGIYSDDIIGNTKFNKFFYNLILRCFK